VDGGDEGQASQHGTLPQDSLGLAGLDLDPCDNQRHQRAFVRVKFDRPFSQEERKEGRDKKNTSRQTHNHDGTFVSDSELTINPLYHTEPWFSHFLALWGLSCIGRRSISRPCFPLSELEAFTHVVSLFSFCFLSSRGELPFPWFSDLFAHR